MGRKKRHRPEDHSYNPRAGTGSARAGRGRDGRAGATARRCNHCGEPGHLSRDCEQRAADEALQRYGRAPLAPGTTPTHEPAAAGRGGRGRGRGGGRGGGRGRGRGGGRAGSTAGGRGGLTGRGERELPARSSAGAAGAAGSSASGSPGSQEAAPPHAAAACQGLGDSSSSRFWGGSPVAADPDGGGAEGRQVAAEGREQLQSEPGVPPASVAPAQAPAAAPAPSAPAAAPDAGASKPEERQQPVARETGSSKQQRKRNKRKRKRGGGSLITVVTE